MARPARQRPRGTPQEPRRRRLGTAAALVVAAGLTVSGSHLSGQALGLLPATVARAQEDAGIGTDGTAGDAGRRDDAGRRHDAGDGTAGGGADAGGEAEGHPDSGGETDADADAEAEGHPDSGGETDADAEAESGAAPETEGGADPDAEGETEGGADRDAGSEPEGETHSGGDSEAEALGGEGAAGPDPQAAAERGLQGEAAMHRRLGRDFYESGRFLEAAGELEVAYAQSNDPALLYEIFLAYRDAARWPKAINALERYLEKAEKVPDRDRLESRLENLRRLAEQRRGPATPPTSEEETASNEDEASAEDEEEPGGADHDDDGGRASPATSADGGSKTSEGEDDASPTPWVVMGVGGALLAGGIVTGVLTLHAEQELEGLCTRVSTADWRCPAGSDFESTRSRGQVLATATDILLISGVLGVGAGLALHFWTGDDGAARAYVSCSSRGCLATVRSSF